MSKANSPLSFELKRRSRTLEADEIFKERLRERRQPRGQERKKDKMEPLELSIVYQKKAELSQPSNFGASLKKEESQE